MVVKWWNELNHQYRNIEFHEQIVMPNHFHGIIQIKSIVGADLCVCPDDTRQKIKTGQSGEYQAKSGEHIGSPLHAMIQWFKTMITNGFIWGGKIIIGNRIKIMATQLL